MEGSNGKSVSSKAFVNIKTSSTSTDENDESISLQNSKKSTTAKHFMSPTISTASKAVAPRKKILAERNENCDTHIPNPLSFSLSDDSLSLSDDSSLKSYDPSKNCTSPRPKFLRYKPNRRREIVLRHDNKVKEMKEEAHLVCASLEGLVKEEVEEEEVEEEEKEEEEEEEEKEGFLRSFLKFVFVFFVLVLFTLYISSMNSPTSSHAFQAIEGLKDNWYPKIHDGVYEAMRSLRGEDNILRTMEFKDFAKIFMGGSEFVGDNMGLMKLNQTFINEGFKEEEMVEDVNFEEVSDNLGEVVELQGGESKDFGELMELQAGGIENSEGFDQMVEDVNLEKVDEVSDNFGEVEELQGGRSKDFGEMEELQASESEIVEGFDQILENAELKGTEEKVEKLESFEDNQESEVVMEPVQEVNNVVAGGSKMVESERITDIETLNSEAESSSKEGLMEQIEMISFMAVVGVALLFVVKVSLLMAFNLTKRNIRKETPLIIRPCSNESGVMEKCNPEIPKEREEHAKCVDSFSSAIPLVNSIVADSKDANQSRGPSIELQSRGPSIELLAEFEVGEISSFPKRCGMKNSRIEESEVSSHSVPMDKEFGNCSKAHSVSSHEIFSEFSAMNSFSYAYITPEKKISKKEQDVRDGEATKVVITPVRRSSRLRNRAITSP